MKIGIDARFYGEAGPGRYVAELLKNLEKTDRENDYVVYLKGENFEVYRPQNLKFKKELANFHWYTLSEQVIFPFRLYRQNFDLVHFTQINVPLFYFRPFVVTVHDLILHEYSTERGHLLRRLLYRLKKILYFLVFAKAVYGSKKIVVPSQATKDDLLKCYKVDANKIIVTHEAVDHYPTSLNVATRIEILKKYNLKKPYLLCLASFYPHKNLKRLVEAFAVLKEKNIFDGQLVLVGKESDFSRMLMAWVGQQGIKDVVFPGVGLKGFNPIGDNYLSDSEVEPILAHALVYVQPSLKEGFGIPPCEAMVFGVPTVVSDIPCLREMCGSASSYFNPKDTNDMVEKIKSLIDDDGWRRSLIEQGYENVKRFSWAKMARETLRVYNYK